MLTDPQAAQLFDRFLDYVTRNDEDLREFEREVSQPTGEYERVFAVEQLMISKGRSLRYRETIENLIERGVEYAFLSEYSSGINSVIGDASARGAVEGLLETIAADLRSLSEQFSGPRVDNKRFVDAMDFEDVAGDALRVLDSFQLILTAVSLEAGTDSATRAYGVLTQTHADILHLLFEESASTPRGRAALRSLSLAFRASQMIFPSFRYHPYGPQSIDAQTGYPWWFALEELDGQEPLALNPDIDERLPEEAQRADVAGDRWDLVERELAPILKDVAEGGIAGAIENIGAREANVGAGHINLIPSANNGLCRPVLLILSDGKSQFKKRLRETHDHLIRCHETRLAVFVTDHWDESYYENERDSTFQALEEATGKRLVVMTMTRGRLVMR